MPNIFDGKTIQVKKMNGFSTLEDHKVNKKYPDLIDSDRESEMQLLLRQFTLPEELFFT